MSPNVSRSQTWKLAAMSCARENRGEGIRRTTEASLRAAIQNDS